MTDAEIEQMIRDAEKATQELRMPTELRTEGLSDAQFYYIKLTREDAINMVNCSPSRIILLLKELLELRKFKEYYHQRISQ